jgi:hypothetical protein
MTTAGCSPTARVVLAPVSHRGDRHADSTAEATQLTHCLDPISALQPTGERDSSLPAPNGPRTHCLRRPAPTRPARGRTCSPPRRSDAEPSPAAARSGSSRPESTASMQRHSGPGHAAEWRGAPPQSKGAPAPCACRARCRRASARCAHRWPTGHTPPSRLDLLDSPPCAVRSDARPLTPRARVQEATTGVGQGL